MFSFSHRSTQKKVQKGKAICHCQAPLVLHLVEVSKLFMVANSVFEFKHSVC